MPVFHQELQLPLSMNREEIRSWVINEFLKEVAGTGTKELSSRYIYKVEKCLTGNDIELSRPATLNYGMDFTVHVRNIMFRERGAFKDRPKHQEIIKDLIIKKQNNAIVYQQLTDILNQIYNCQPFDMQTLQNLSIPFGLLSCEEVALTIKWLWIEQDVTYWNYSGRAMFYSALQQNDLI